jgi:hypothetical protein
MRLPRGIGKLWKCSRALWFAPNASTSDADSQNVWSLPSFVGDVGLGQLGDEQADLLAALADARDQTDQAAVVRVGDPQLVARAVGEQRQQSFVFVELDVGLDLLGVDADADLAQREAHQGAFGEQWQERALLGVGAVGEEAARTDRQLAADLDRERSEAVRRELLLGDGELRVARRRRRRTRPPP